MAAGRREGLVWALLGVVLFSFSVPLTKLAVAGFDTFLTATGRAALAGALAVALLAWRGCLAAARGAATALPDDVGAVFGWPNLLF